MLRELKTYHDEVRQAVSVSRAQQSTTTAIVDVEQAATFRHQYTVSFNDYWKHQLSGDFALNTSKNEYQAAYELYARIPIFTPRGRMAFVLSLSLRKLHGYLPNVSVLGGGINFLNMVPADSEIVSACKSGDILAVRNLFREKKAAPNDMCVSGRTLLYVSSIINVVICRLGH